MHVYEIRERFGLDALVRGERPQPKPGPGEVLLKIRAVSLNYRDLITVKGVYNPRLALPRIPVSDAVAEVAAVGDGVSRVRVGQRVCPCFMPRWLDGEITDEAARSALGGDVDGLLAEYAVLSQEGLVIVPDYLSDEEAATLPCAAVTAYHALEVARRRQQQGEKMDTVLVQGTGGVALFALQLAHADGRRVLITSSSDGKLKRALDMGASEGINYKTTPEWGAEARKRTGGKGVDQVIELGGAGTLPQSFRAVRIGGHISLIGVLSGNAGEVNPVPVLMKSLSVQGIYVGSRAHFERLVQTCEQHRIRPVVDHVFPFAEAVQAFRHMEGASHFGKIVIRVAG
jgi:NADPH:quinone reductase-like Zn-dependent oxidoreductase